MAYCTVCGKKTSNPGMYGICRQCLHEHYGYFSL